VLRGRCFELDHAVPDAGLLDLLRANLGPLPPHAVAAELGPLAPHLFGLLPEYTLVLATCPICGSLNSAVWRRNGRKATVPELGPHDRPGGQARG